MRPVLAFIAAGEEHQIKNVISFLADQLHLTDEDRATMLPSGKQSLLANRVHWAITYLAKAGALERTRRSHIRVTDRGLRLLKENPDRIGVKVLQQFPEFLAFQAPATSGESKWLRGAERCGIGGHWGAASRYAGGSDPGGGGRHPHYVARSASRPHR